MKNFIFYLLAELMSPGYKGYVQSEARKIYNWLMYTGGEENISEEYAKNIYAISILPMLKKFQLRNDPRIKKIINDYFNS